MLRLSTVFAATVLFGLSINTAIAGSWVVVVSTSADAEVGSVLADEDTVAVADGQSLTLLGEDGSELTVAGPYSGAIAKVAREVLGERPSDDRVATIRSVDAEKEKASAPPPISAEELSTMLTPIVGDEEFRKVDLDIRFASGSSFLTHTAMAQLDELGKAITDGGLAGHEFEINGHTDSVGKESYNLALSKRRAGAVMAYLVIMHGIHPAQMKAQGFGETRLKNTAAPEAAENRRVEIINLTKAQEDGGGWQTFN